MDLTDILNSAKKTVNFVPNQVDKVVNSTVNWGMSRSAQTKNRIRKFVPDKIIDGLKTAGSKTRRTIDYVVGYGSLPAGVAILYGIEKIPGVAMQKPVFDFYQNNTDWVVGLTAGILTSIGVGAYALIPQVRTAVGTAYDRLIETARASPVPVAISALALLAALGGGIYFGVTSKPSDTEEEPIKVEAPVDITATLTPTPTATIVPTPTQVPPTEAPTQVPGVVAPTQAPTPTPPYTPTPKPLPTETPVPTPTPPYTPTPKPLPTETPVPIPTQAPTPTPPYTPTPKPTSTPVPTATPKPTPEVYNPATPKVLYDGCTDKDATKDRPSTPYYSTKPKDRVIEVTRGLLQDIRSATNATDDQFSKLEFTLNQAEMEGNSPFIFFAPNVIKDCTDMGVFALDPKRKVISGLYLELSKGAANKLAPNYGMPTPLDNLTN
ncbi:MAG: hypothetical protein IH934_00490 [Nanoarchaeota archaeon]|nr:hypothetical protein [Nanoarchaeota archaeon]